MSHSSNAHFGRDVTAIPPGGTRTLLAFDIVGFGDPNRDDDTRKYIRDRFYELMEASFRAAEIDIPACYWEDRGDGAVIILPPDARLAFFLEPLLTRLRADIHRHNRFSAASAQFRLRLAVHIGEVDHDRHGLVGTDVNFVFRLLDSAPVKEAIRAPGAYLALIVSDRVYTSVVRGSAGGTMVPEDYTPVRVVLKEIDTQAWLRVPGASPAARPGPGDDRVPATRDVPAFTGRDDILARLDALADAHPDSSSVAVLAGMPGAGKTAVAMHWAHHHAARFPDGRIHVDLGAFTSHPMRPDDALTQVLREIGTEQASVPADPHERLRMWRSWTASRCVLLVLDDAGEFEQVRNLIAQGPGCMTLVTSRSTLESLAAEFGAVSVEVPVLAPDDAIALVRTIIGADRADREPEAVESLVSRCAELPIALRIAAAKLAVRPRRTVAEQVAELAGAGRLTALRLTDTPSVAVTHVFDASYDGLRTEIRQALRRTALVPGPTFTAASMAHLLGVPEESAAAMLDELEREHLVEASAGRYRVHDLLHEYCRTRLEAEESRPEQRTAFQALLDGYVRTAIGYRHQLGRPGRWFGAGADRPGERDAAQHRAALAWFESEWLNLAAAARAAHRAGLWEATIQLADALFDVLDLTRRMTENSELQRLAVDAAEQQGAKPVQVLCLQRLALCARATGDYETALKHANRALTLAQGLSDHVLESDARRIIGSVLWHMADFVQALEHARSALRFARAAGEDRAEASALNLVAMIERRCGLHQSAYENAQAALDIWQRRGDRENEAVALDNIARVLPRTHGRTDSDALSPQEGALDLFRKFGDRRGEAEALDGMARIYRRLERFGEAIECAEQARDIRRDIGDSRGEAESWETLAHAHRSLGDRTSNPGEYVTARTCAERGLRVAREIGDRYGEASLLSNYARILLAIGDIERAEAAVEEAVQIGADLTDPFGQARRLKNSALVLRAAGKPDQAEIRLRHARHLEEELARSGLPEE